MIQNSKNQSPSRPTFKRLPGPFGQGLKNYSITDSTPTRKQEAEASHFLHSIDNVIENFKNK